jgi:nucleoid-associated protein YgaU
MAIYSVQSRYTSNGKEADRIGQVGSRYVPYTVRQGDTLEGISLRHLGDTKRYWEIADLNPQVKFPTDLVVGMIIRLPK